MSPRLTREERSLEPERYELDEGPAYRFDLGRREFLGVLGAGLLVTASAAEALAQQRRRPGGRGDDGGTIADRVHIGADGAITVLTGKVEVGQGSRTQISMAAAEELRVPLASVRLVMADSSLSPDDGGTYGSRTTPATIPRVRRACAAARELLAETAARQWRVDRAAVSVREGKVVEDGTDRVATFAELVGRHFADGLQREVQTGVTVTSVSEWRILGTSRGRVNGSEIVTGRHRYPSDMRRPGTLHGVVLRPPSFGATLAAIDLAAARSIDGVVAVRDGDFAGFAAPTSWLARKAREAVSGTARWNETSHPDGDALYEHLKEHSREGGSRFGRRGGRPRERGSVDEAIKSAARVLRATYHIAYVQHAPMETRAALAEWDAGSVTVWTGTQNPSRVRDQVAEAFRISEERVRVIVPDTGGGFGGKHTGEVAIEAARLAREAGKPVAVQWTREEEFTWAYFRPAGVIELAGGLDGAGKLMAWEQTNYNSGASALATSYDVPNSRSRYRSSDAPLRQGAYRALASTANVFARECFMDELAATAGVDPLDFRLRHLGDARLRAVLEAAAERFRWSERVRATRGSGRRGVGLGCGTEKGSYAAACAEVEVSPETGRYRVVEVCQAFECGAIQNPDNLRAQVEGCIVQGLGGALSEEIRFRDGRIRNASFSSYRVPRFRNVPAIATVLVDRPDLPSVGGGETPIVAVAPAVGNALFAAAGVRIRSLPLRGEGFRSA